MAESKEAHRRGAVDLATALAVYELTVEMADRVSARRATANSFFLSVLTAIVALAGATDVEKWSLAAPGIVLALAWLLILRSYRHLSSKKWEVVGDLETRVGLSPFTDEWVKLKGDPENKLPVRERYTELGIIESVVPILFLIILGAFWIA